MSGVSIDMFGGNVSSRPSYNRRVFLISLNFTVQPTDHIVGTYDGTMLRMYINGLLVRSAKVEPSAREQAKAFMRERREEAENLKFLEFEGKQKAEEETEVREEKWLNEDESGKRHLKSMMQKLMKQADMRYKMDKKAGEKGLKRMTKQEAKIKATDTHVAEKVAEAREAVAKIFEEKRRALREKDEKHEQ